MTSVLTSSFPSRAIIHPLDWTNQNRQLFLLLANPRVACDSHHRQGGDDPTINTPMGEGGDRTHYTAPPFKK